MANKRIIWIPGPDLTPAQRRQVLGSFVSRDTVEAPLCNALRDEAGYTGPRLTNQAWLESHKFCFYDGLPTALEPIKEGEPRRPQRIEMAHQG